MVLNPANPRPATADDTARAREIAASWQDNAAAWTEAVRGQAIESRRVATDAAIVNAVLARRPALTLDLGCGEGWLVRALTGHGFEAVGVDGSAPLVEAATKAHGGTFYCLSYESIVEAPARCGEGFDLVVANFALLDADVVPLLAALRAVMTADATLLIQTVHPLNVAPPHEDGWRTEDFRGFGETAWTPMPWYFRTLASWVGTLRDAGFALAGLEESSHPDDGRPLSLLLAARPASLSKESVPGAR
ncbi:MAG: class I SAM-dependent methyltransferase [Candidatus Eiseniibacteriota bacterium]